MYPVHIYAISANLIFLWFWDFYGAMRLYEKITFVQSMLFAWIFLDSGCIY